jgi:hypothetical protein
LSTRTNIIIEYGDSRVYLYRHHDGYLAETGADLARKLAATNGYLGANRFVRSLIEEAYEKQSYETEAKRIYEVTSEVHGDIEYLYVVRFDTNDSIKPQIGYRTYRGSEGPGGNAGPNSVKNMGSLADFVLAVNAEVRATNRRIAEMRRAQPAAYGDASDMPEVVLA